MVERNPREGRETDPAPRQLPSAPAGRARELEAADVAPERVAISGREIYAWYANGIRAAAGKLLDDSRLGVVSTARNWNTVVKLLELASEGAPGGAPSASLGDGHRRQRERGVERHLEAGDTGCVRRDRAGERVLAVPGRVPERQVERRVRGGRPPMLYAGGSADVVLRSRPRESRPISVRCAVDRRRRRRAPSPTGPGTPSFQSSSTHGATCSTCQPRCGRLEQQVAARGRPGRAAIPRTPARSARRASCSSRVYLPQYASHLTDPVKPSCAAARSNQSCWNAAMFVRAMSVPSSQ